MSFIQIQRLKYLIETQHTLLVKQHKMIDNLRIEICALETDIEELKKQLDVFTNMDADILYKLNKENYIESLISAKNEAMNKNRKLEYQNAGLLKRLKN